MSSDEERDRHRRRRSKQRSVIARSLEDKRFRQQKTPTKRVEDEEEKKFRRYGIRGIESDE